jgi:hypothetical protein
MEECMGKREHYAPGTFCWVDLATTDPGDLHLLHPISEIERYDGI